MSGSGTASVRQASFAADLREGSVAGLIKVRAGFGGSGRGLNALQAVSARSRYGIIGDDGLFS
jgi:hypothetical protein